MSVHPSPFYPSIYLSPISFLLFISIYQSIHPFIYHLPIYLSHSYSPSLSLSSFLLLHISSVVISFSKVLEILFYVIIIFSIIFLKAKTASSTPSPPFLSFRVLVIKLAFNKHLLVWFFPWKCLRFSFASIFSRTLLISVRLPYPLNFNDQENVPFAWTGPLRYLLSWSWVSRIFWVISTDWRTLPYLWLCCIFHWVPLMGHPTEKGKMTSGLI